MQEAPTKRASSARSVRDRICSAEPPTPQGDSRRVAAPDELDVDGARGKAVATASAHVERVAHVDAARGRHVLAVCDAGACGCRSRDLYGRRAVLHPRSRCAVAAGATKAADLE